MRILGFVVLGLLGLLSLAAGAAKLAQAPQEVEFFASVGLGAVWLYPLGALQVVGAIACIPTRSRKLGIAAVVLGFAISAAMIFATGNAVFGAVSLMPAALAAWLFIKTPGTANVTGAELEKHGG
jgi:DoxX-like family